MKSSLKPILVIFFQRKDDSELTASTNCDMLDGNEVMLRNYGTIAVVNHRLETSILLQMEHFTELFFTLAG